MLDLVSQPHRAARWYNGIVTIYVSLESSMEHLATLTVPTFTTTTATTTALHTWQQSNTELYVLCCCKDMEVEK